MIQKNLFFIWLGSQKPPFADFVISQFKKTNPSFNVEFIYEPNLELTKNKDILEVKRLISDTTSFYHRFYNRKYTRKNAKDPVTMHALNLSNCLRFYLVYKYGGIYLDLDTFPVRAFDERLLNNRNFIIQVFSKTASHFIDICFFGAERGFPPENMIDYTPGDNEYRLISADKLIMYPYLEWIKYFKNKRDRLVKKLFDRILVVGESLFSGKIGDLYYVDHFYVQSWQK